MLVIKMTKLIIISEINDPLDQVFALLEDQFLRLTPRTQILIVTNRIYCLSAFTILEQARPSP